MTNVNSNTAQSPNSNLHLAPPAKRVDDLMAVPIDIQQLDTHVVFDMASKSARVKATMLFLSGPNDGNPVFDLRQEILEVYLNKERLPVEMVQHHDFGGGADAQLRILQKVIPSTSENTLTMIYNLNQPQSPRSQPIGWDPPRLYFEFWFSDLYPARYLEMWFPSNLIYDQFKFNLKIEIINTGIDHAIFSNGRIATLGKNHWQIEFPDRFTSFSPMLCIVASDMIEFCHDVMTLPDNGNVLHLDTFKLSGTSADLVAIQNDLKEHIANNVTNIGPYIHGDRFTTFIWSTRGRSMDNDGGVTTEPEALKHEVFHSWFARGIKPATQNDSWIDEGWTVYNTSENFQQIQPFDLSEDPVPLSSTSTPYNRITPNSDPSPNAYRDGSRFFAGLASVISYDNLRSYMSSFYRANMANLVTTGLLETYLRQKSGMKEISQFFYRFVYGLDT